jgi:protein-disulfide isomerase
MLTASWCGPCQQAELKHSELVVVDVEGAYGQQLMQQHGIRGLPAFIAADGQVWAGSLEDVLDKPN